MHIFCQVIPSRLIAFTLQGLPYCHISPQKHKFQVIWQNSEILVLSAKLINQLCSVGMNVQCKIPVNMCNIMLHASKSSYIFSNLSEENL